MSRLPALRAGRYEELTNAADHSLGCWHTRLFKIGQIRVALVVSIRAGSETRSRLDNAALALSATSPAKEF